MSGRMDAYVNHRHDMIKLAEYDSSWVTLGDFG